eukprot:jgi/Chlat1/1839/Chrsp14S02230
MGKSKTSGKGRLDKFYYLAKEQGYRSRAAFKLVQLNRKYGFLEKCTSLLDLCAAPGGWLQVAAKYMPVSSLVIGVDLAPIAPIRGCVTLMEDITTNKCRAAVKRELRGAVLDVVLHDGSPNVGGAWASEAFTQAALSLDALKLAVEFLAPGGWFISKVFRSQDYNPLLYAFNQLFDRVESTKPMASRNTSAEIYVVCRGYKAPAKIDPRLLDSRHLFKETDEAPKTVDVMRDTKRKRHREGYEDGASTLYKSCSVLDFVNSDKPVEMLGQYSNFSLSGPDCTAVASHANTTDEVRTWNTGYLLGCSHIKELCADLKVLGKREFKQLLRWRVQMRQQLNTTAVDASDDEEDDTDKEDQTEENGTEAQDGDEDASEEKKLLAEMRELKASIDAKKRRVKKRLMKSKAKQRLTSILREPPKRGCGDSGRDWREEKRPNHMRLDEMDEDEALKTLQKRVKLPDTVDEAEANPLIVSLDKKASKKPSAGKVTEQWFGQPVFAQFAAAAGAGIDNDDDDGDDVAGVAITHNKSVKPPRTDAMDTSEDEEQEDEGTLMRKAAAATATTSAKADDSGFQVVPAEMKDGSDDSIDTSDYDTDDKAAVLAYGQKILRKKQREDMLDAAYNRYAFHDDNLPRWFVEDERKHMKAQAPITKEEMEAAKATFKAIDARPIKKVAEAKARRRKRMTKKLEAVKVRANVIADMGDVPEKSKSKMIAKLYAKAASTGGKGKGGKSGGKMTRKEAAKPSGPRLDRRMKSDRRKLGAGKAATRKGHAKPAPVNKAGKGARKAKGRR